MSRARRVARLAIAWSTSDEVMTHASPQPSAGPVKSQVPYRLTRVGVGGIGRTQCGGLAKGYQLSSATTAPYRAKERELMRASPGKQAISPDGEAMRPKKALRQIAAIADGSAVLAAGDVALRERMNAILELARQGLAFKRDNSEDQGAS